LRIPRVILAAVSFSAASRVALTLAAWLAQQYGAELHVLHVEDPLLLSAADYLGFDLIADTQLQLQLLLAEIWPAATSLPLSHVIAGPDVDVVLDVAHRAGADLVVVGQGSMSAPERLLFESMAAGLLKRADMQVIVAPTRWTPPETTPCTN
jgi:nucleotide-binding universal stress UspA family protein